MDLGPIMEAARRANPELPEDYRDPETGLLMCGQCHTPKEMTLEIFGQTDIVRVMCKCANERYEAEQAAERERKRLQIVARRREKCFGYGSRKASFTFAADDGGDPRTMQVARGYVERFPDMRVRGKGLLFLGCTGTGKTFAACCIANALLDRDYTVRAATFAEIAARLQGTRDRQEIYSDLARPDLLVLDDLGAERGTSYMDEIVFTVVDTRSAARKPMIVTTNLSVEDFLNGPLSKNRVYSRLYEMCLPVTVTGPDRRRQRMLQETAGDLAELMRAGE